MGRQPRRARGPEDGVSYCSNAAADDLAGIVDVDGSTPAAVTREGPEARHHAILPEECVDLPERTETVSDDLACVIYAYRDTTKIARECPESCHHVVLPKERMECKGGV